MSDDLYSGFDDIAGGLPGDEPTTEFWDAPKKVVADIAGTGAAMATAGQFAAEQSGNPNFAHFMRGLSMLGHQAADYATESMSEGGKRDVGASFLPEEGEASVYAHPMGSAWMKGAGLVVPIAIGSLGELAGGPAGIAAAGGAAQMMQGIDSSIAWTNDLSDEELAKQSPVFKKYLEESGGDADRARAMLHADQYSWKQAAADAASGAVAYGVAGRALRGGLGAGESSALVNAALGVGETGAGVGASAGVSNYGQQWGQLAATSPDEDVDWGKVAHATINGGVEGMVLAGAAAGAHHYLKVGEARANKPSPDKTVGAIPDEAVLNTPHTAGGTSPGPAVAPVTKEQTTTVQYPKESAPGAVTPEGNGAGKPPIQVTDALPADVLTAMENTQTPKQETPAPVQATPPAPAGEAPVPPAAQESMQRVEPAPAPTLDTGQNVPESPDTLALQRQALIDGLRPAVMYPAGTKPLSRPKGMKTLKNNRGLFHYNPELITPEAIRAASKEGRENEILGLGPVSKPEAEARAAMGEAPVAVTERTPEGVEAKAAVGTEGTAPEQVSALEASKSAPENTVQVEPITQVPAEREKARTEQERHAAEIMSPTEARAGREPGRVLEDVRPEAISKGKKIAKAVRKKQLAAEASLKPTPEPQAKHRTKAEVEARAKGNEVATKVVAAHAPGEGEVAYAGNGTKAVGVAQTKARSAIMQRARAMVEAAKAEGVEIPRIAGRKNVDESQGHNAEMVLLSEAQRLAGLKSPKKEDFERFFVAEILLRSGKKEEVLQERRVEGDIAKRKDQGDVETRPEEVLLGREENEAAKEEEDHSAAITGTEKEVYARGRERSAPVPENAVTGVKSQEGKFKVEPIKKRTFSKPGVGPKGEKVLQRIALARESVNRKPTEAETPFDESPTFTHAGKEYEAHQTVTVREALNSLHLPKTGLIGHIMSLLRTRLITMAADVPVHFVPEETLSKLAKSEGALAFYDSIRHQIVVSERVLGRPDGGTHVIMHEAVHAAIWHALDRDKNLRSLVEKFGKLVRDHYAEFGPGYIEGHDINAHYGMGAGKAFDPHEFMSESMTNRGFNSLVSGVELPPEVARHLNLTVRRATVWDGIVGMVRKVLGMPPHSTTVLEGVMRVFEQAADRNDTGRRLFNAGLSRHQLPQAHYSVTEAGNRAMEFIRDKMEDNDSILRVGLQLLTNDQALQATKRMVGDAFNAAHTKLNDAMERMGVRMREYREQGNDVVKEMARMRRKYQGEVWDKYTALTGDATLYDLHPDQPLDSAANRHLDVSKETRQKLAAGKDVSHEAAMNVWQARAKHAELARRYEALPDDLKALWSKANAYYREKQNAVTRANVETIIRDVELPSEVNRNEVIDRIVNGKMTEEDKALFEKPVAEALENAQELRVKNGAYSPLMRHGDYVLNAKHVVKTPRGATRLNDEGVPDAKGDVFEFSGKDARKQAHDFATSLDLHATPESVYYDPATGERTTEEGGISTAGGPEQRFQVKVQRQHTEFFESKGDARRRRQELSQSPNVEDITDVDKRELNPKVDYELSSPQIRALVDAARRSGRTPKEKEVIEKALMDSLLSLRAGTRVEHRRLPRRNVQGASDDLVRNTIAYNNSVSAYLSRHDFKPTVDAAMDEMRGITGEGKSSGLTTDRRTVLQEMENRLYGFGSPEYTGRLAPFWQHAMTLSFLKRMASPAHLLIHMTHPTMISGPVLGARHGFGTAYGALVRAYKDMGAMGALSEGMRGAKRVWQDDTAHPTNFVEYFKGKLSSAKDHAALGKMLDELSATGHIHPDAGFEVHRLDSTGGKLSKGLARVDTAFRELTGATESINRVAEAVAAYRLERAKGADHDAAVAYVKQTLANTQGLYSFTNAAPIFRNPRLRPFLQFKQFPQMIYHLLVRNLYDAFKGETPEIRREAARAFAGVVGTHAAMAGVLGLPMELAKAPVMFANMLGVTNTNWGDIEEAAQEKAAHMFGPQLAEIVMHGLSHALGPLSVDVHHRLGLNSLLAFGEPKSGKSSDVMKWVYDTVGGAPMSMATDTLDATTALFAGDYVKAAEKIIPAKAIADLLKAARLTSEGKPSKQGVGMKPLSLPEAIVQGLGFTPASVSQYGEARYAAGKEMHREVVERDTLLRTWAEATGAARGRARIEIDRWNRTHDRDHQITSRVLSGALKRRQNTQAENGLGYGLTKRNRETIKKYEKVFNVQ